MDDINPIIRLIRIDLITDKPNQITTWFNDLYTKLEMFEVEISGEQVFYIDKDVIFAKYNKNTWFHYKKFWGIIDDILNNDYDAAYNISYVEVQEIIILLFESKNKHIGIPYIFENEIEYFYYQRLLDRRTEKYTLLNE